MGSQTCLLFQEKIIFDIVRFSFVIYIYIYISYNLKYDNPILVKKKKKELARDGKEIAFVWAPSHVGIRGNSAADSAAEDALDGHISDELISFSGVKSRVNGYVLQLWQSEWYEFLENELHKVFPDLKDCTTCPRPNRREETDIPAAHWSLLCYSFLFIGGRGATNVYRM